MPSCTYETQLQAHNSFDEQKNICFSTSTTITPHPMFNMPKGDETLREKERRLGIAPSPMEQVSRTISDAEAIRMSLNQRIATTATALAALLATAAIAASFNEIAKQLQGKLPADAHQAAEQILKRHIRK